MVRDGQAGGVVQEARETVRKREAETAGRWGLLSEAAAAHFEAAGDTLEQLSAATSALVALKQAQESCVAGWGTAAEGAAQSLRKQGSAAVEAAPDGAALLKARDDAAAALQAATEPVVEALEGVLQKQEDLQVRWVSCCRCCRVGHETEVCGCVCVCLLHGGVPTWHLPYRQDSQPDGWVVWVARAWRRDWC